MGEHDAKKPDGEKKQMKPESDHACAYCGIDSPSCVVKCGTCKRWFCNSTEGTSISHIVRHLRSSLHNVISLHPDSKMADAVLQCCRCSCKNVFVLGTVPTEGESSPIFLCRIPCTFAEESNWNVKKWKPLIEGRQHLKHITEEPGAEERKKARSVKSKEILILEAKWKHNKNATIEDIYIRSKKEKKISRVPSQYQNKLEYTDSFKPLIEGVARYDKIRRESQILENVSVTWSVGPKKQHWASFDISQSELEDFEIALCDQMFLNHSGAASSPPWSAKGSVVQRPDQIQSRVTLEFSRNKKPPTQLHEGFKVKFIWQSQPYDRMHSALEKFAFNDSAISKFLSPKLLGQQVEENNVSISLPRRLSIPSFVALNATQTFAVEHALQNPFSLIQGPPGTGKTVTSATIVYHLSKMHNGPILVCAPSNVAVDNLAAKLNTLSLKVVRLVSRSKQGSYDCDFALHNMVFKRATAELQRLIKLKDAGEELTGQEYREYVKKAKKIERSIFKEADVVCCTCVGAGDKRLRKEKFPNVLIDESAQALETECLIPLMKGAAHAILVGDHQQLGPVVLEHRLGKAGLERSLFERLISLGHVPLRLGVQYRMNPTLSEFPSNKFYDGSLQNGVTELQRGLPRSTFPWPVPEVPMMFWAHYNKEELSSNGTSSLNTTEAIMCERIISKLFQEGIKPEQIGVITSYKGQKSYILQYMQLVGSRYNKPDYSAVEVASVNAFQGREKDFIIFSCVRSNNDKVIGFLSDRRRLNVALTRAKYGLMILGNPRVLSKDALWSSLIAHFKRKDCMVEGPWDKLPPCVVAPSLENILVPSPEEDEESEESPKQKRKREKAKRKRQRKRELKQKELKQKVSNLKAN